MKVCIFKVYKPNGAFLSSVIQKMNKYSLIHNNKCITELNNISVYNIKIQTSYYLLVKIC